VTTISLPANAPVRACSIAAGIFGTTVMMGDISRRHLDRNRSASVVEIGNVFSCVAAAAGRLNLTTPTIERGCRRRVVSITCTWPHPLQRSRARIDSVTSPEWPSPPVLMLVIGGEALAAS
jgi:hypothetical protein